MLNALTQDLSLQITRNLEYDAWPLEYMIKLFRTEIQTKERSVSDGTSFKL